VLRASDNDNDNQYYLDKVIARLFEHVLQRIIN
jgi:hypothetical protein